MLLKLRSFLRNKYDKLFCDNSINYIRLGSINQWVIIPDLPLKVVYSGGVGNDISFELELVRLYSSNIYLFDPSPTGINTIKSFSRLPNNINFSSIGLYKHDGFFSFSSPRDLNEGSYYINYENNDSSNFKFECRSLSSLTKENSHSRIDLLKIDIEGSEYSVLDDIFYNHLDVAQICVEFHHERNFLSRKLKMNYLKKLKMNGFYLFYKNRNDYSFVNMKYFKVNKVN